MKKNMPGVVVIFLSWLVGYFVVRVLGSGLSAVEAYAIMSGWWLCAYASSKIGVSLASAAVGGVLYFVLFMMVALLGYGFLYRGIEGVGLGVVFIAVLQALMFVSPVLFDGVAGYVLAKLR